jgi:hypothetical protein
MLKVRKRMVKKMTGNKSIISYIGDLALQPHDDVLLVDQDADYVRACHILTQRRDSDSDQKIWVRSKNHFAWLRDFTGQIACPAHFEEKTPRVVLAEQWNVDIPDWLRDADVLDHHLLEIKVASQKSMRFETRYLSHFLGAAFDKHVLSSTELVSVIMGLVNDDGKAAFKEHPLLGRCLKSKCQLWAEKSGKAWVKKICTRLYEDAANVWHLLSLWTILHGYPGKLLEFVLSPEQMFFVREVPPAEMGDLPLEPTAREQIVTQLELFFNEIREQIHSSNDFKKVIGCASGGLLQEYQFVSSILKSGQFAPTLSDIQAMREKFAFCPGISKSQLNSLIYHVKPVRPTLLKPGEEWSGPEWIRWTTKEYMPYRTWQIHNGYCDDDLEQTVARFSDWYIGEYASIHKDPDLSLTHCLRDIASSGSKDELAIILLIDCLPLFFMDILEDALRNIGLSRHNMNYRFAGLPTDTEHNKAALLGGEWQDKAGNYEAILKMRAASDWSGRNVVYLSNLKAMSEMAAPQKSTIAVLNFIDGDELLHSDVESKNTSYEDELHRLFLRVAEAVSRLSQNWEGSNERFNVYVVTDHGACRILEEEKRSFDSAIVKDLFADGKYRFSPVTEEQANEVPQNLWVIGHRFKRPFASENTSFFLPRGHNTVRPAGAVKGFMHGGVTPEEVIVPTAFYKMVKAAWKKLAARFLNLDIVKETGRAKFYIQRVVTLNIELQNPNAADIHILRATVISPESDLKSCEAITIPAASVKPLTINCYFKKTALGNNPLEIEVVYEISGEQHMLPLVLGSEFKSAMAGGFSLKDL